MEVMGKMGNVTLEMMHKDLESLKKEMVGIKEDINELRDIELEVRPEYLEKLNKIEKGKFLSRKDFEKEMADQSKNGIQRRIQ